ncbi:MAG TPA: acyl-CoA dehydrogenase family protein [Bdellovibrionota bacterium]|nr:acyl-CoA dehydrogenase family protein [Bdellovibrionota bacterium]
MPEAVPTPVTDQEAESKSFAKSLFAGHIREDMVFPYPEPKSGEREMITLVLENLHKFAKEHIDSAKIDREGQIPKEALGALAEMGLFGMQIPEKYGGIGLSQIAYGRVCEEIASIDASIAVTLGAHQSIGLKGLLLFGSDEQKQKYLPQLASGKIIAAFALTEPGSGSDAYSIKTRAVRQPDGSFVLNGNKIWITNGGLAGFFTVFAKTEMESKGETKDKVTAFLVTRDMAGVSTGKDEHKLGIRGSSTTEVAFQNVRVPAENVLGEPGRGFKIAMEILNSGRLGLASGCVGGAKRLLALATQHATQRQQFGKPIAEFGLIKDKLGRMSIDIYVAESIAYLTCGMIDAGVEDYSIESAICKVSGSEMAWNVANEATQIAGGTGYMAEYPYERMLRDARINMIFEGTNEILRCFIALSGMKGVGEYLKIVGEALNEPIKSLGVLYDYFVSQKLSRTLSSDKFTKAHAEVKREAEFIEKHVQELVDAVEKSIRKHKKKIWEKQFVQKRIADIAIDLYRMTAVVSRVSRSIELKGLKAAQTELTMVQAFCAEANRQVTRNLRNMNRNVDEQLKSVSAEACKAQGYPVPLYP